MISTGSQGWEKRSGPGHNRGESFLGLGHPLGLRLRAPHDCEYLESPFRKIRVQAIVHPLPPTIVLDYAEASKLREMARDQRLRDAQRLYQLTDAQFRLHQEKQQARHSCRIGESLEE